MFPARLKEKSQVVTDLNQKVEELSGALEQHRLENTSDLRTKVDDKDKLLQELQEEVRQN